MPAGVRRSFVRNAAPWLVALFLFSLWAVAARSGFISSGGADSPWLAVRWGAMLSLSVLFWRLALVARYRPIESVDDARLPPLTVIVPAYNEGRQVYETLRSLAESDYPKDRLQIIAVDDGSVDDTWRWIDRGAQDLGSLVTPIRCRVNRGKRAVLFEGFKRATGDVIVTVDSDSEVLPDSLRNLIAPIVVDTRVGAVAGNVRVLNDKTVMGRMLDVTFTYAFDFMRASESMVDTVACCPGALSAFRRSVVDQVRDEWLHQTFLGIPAKIGEDRAMTNLVLQRGFTVKFQSNAIVLTQVPEALPQLSRMFLRWARSNVRESICLGAFVFRRFRSGSLLGTRINFIWSSWNMLLDVASFLPLVVLVLTRPWAIGWLMLGLGISALFPAAVYATRRGATHALWAFPYTVFSAVCLSWISLYALLTLRQSSWMTRQKALPANPAVSMQLADAGPGGQPG